MVTHHVGCRTALYIQRLLGNRLIDQAKLYYLNSYQMPSIIDKLCFIPIISTEILSIFQVAFIPAKPLFSLPGYLSAYYRTPQNARYQAALLPESSLACGIPLVARRSCHCSNQSAAWHFYCRCSGLPGAGGSGACCGCRAISANPP